jgi:protein-S-isoprenylcysteine O-methyltransferase Ste14
MQPNSTADRHSTARRVAQLLVFTGLWMTALLASAGRLDWARAWIYMGLSLTLMAVTARILARVNPELIGARGRWHKDTKGFDKVFMVLYVVLLAGQAVVAGLDAVRYQWSALPFWTIFAGGALFVTGWAGIAWAMAVNPFLETTVRLQTERGHHVIETGPYAYVRHPMYLGMFFTFAAIPLILGSAWALVVSALIAVLMVWRTRREDATLQAELPGYADYARRTRWRLAPGLW